jgi:phage major head subunit gpT-like protein
MPKTKKEFQRSIEGATVERKLTIDNATAVNEEKRTVSFIMISDDNAGKRRDWDGSIYIEVLDVKGANPERLRTFFKDHNRLTDSAIGKIENKRVEDGKFKADVVFGSDENSDAVFRKYVEGILSDCSVTYIPTKVSIEERSGEPDLVTVLEYDLVECSAVGVGFDAGAMVGRDLNLKGEEPMNEELRRELQSLKDKVESLSDSEKARKEELEKLEREDQVSKTSKTAGADEEQKRSSEIMSMVVAGHLTIERAKEYIDKKDSLDVVRAAILEEKARGTQTVVPGAPTAKVELQRGIEDAILMRCGYTPAQVSDQAATFRGASLLDMARAMTGYDGYDKNELVQRAMGTDDFPMLLGNVANRVIAGAFNEEEGTFAQWTQEVELPDFRKRTEVKLSSAGGRLQKLKEKSEKKNIEFAESGEAWAIESYGAEFKLTREMIINDDLGVFTGIVAEFGKMAKRTSNGLVYDLAQNRGDFTNYKMNDGKKIFDTAHNNTDTAAALASESLSKGRTIMRRQKDAAGNALNISPKFLLVAPEQERTALQLLNSEADVSGSNSGVTNPHKNTLTPVVDSELAAGAWYLAASTNTIKVGYLQGTNKQPVVQQISSNIDGAEFKCVFDFGVVVTDYRGLFKNLGA